MKTAEEWFNILQVEPLGAVSFNEKQDKEYFDLIKQIQLDAYRAGMTEAAEIANYSANGFEGEHYKAAAFQVEESILSARDKKETL